MSRKRGKLSTEEEEFIVKNIAGMSIAEIAEAINRNAEPIKKFVIKRRLIAEKTTDEVEDDNRLLTLLHSKPYWKTLAESFTKDEIVYFEGNWMMVIRQFNEEITAGEEIHLNNWLTTQILQSRCLKAQKNAMEEIEEVRRQIEIENRKPDYERNVPLLASLQTQLSLLEGSLSQYTGTHTKLLSEVKNISNLLKATREEKRNIKLDEDTWWGYIAKLENEVFRKQESKRAELLKFATAKARKRMGELHEFCDGTVDRVLLNSETVMEE